eukprot:m.88324 g.88324  ORF g.88324 m.88324 type:complete len:708 (+) comp8805_c1_seq1:60-2183(+)
MCDMAASIMFTMMVVLFSMTLTTRQVLGQCSANCPPGEGCGASGTQGSTCEACANSYFSSSSDGLPCTFCSDCTFFSNPMRYENAACTPSSDSDCQPCSECTSTEYFVSACTTTSNTVCNPCTVCGLGKIEVSACTGTEDTVCKECNGTHFHRFATDTFCSLCDVCTDYEYKVAACTPTTDTVCIHHALCSDHDQFMTAPGTPSSDTVCQNCTLCTSGMYESVPCTETLDRMCVACTTVNDCSSTQYLDGTCSETFNPTCTNCSQACPEGKYIASTCTSSSDIVCASCSQCTGGDVVLQECTPQQDTMCGPLPEPHVLDVVQQTPSANAIQYFINNGAPFFAPISEIAVPCTVPSCTPSEVTAFNTQRVFLPLQGTSDVVDCTPVEISYPGEYFSDCVAEESLGQATSCLSPSSSGPLRNNWLGMELFSAPLHVTGRVLGTNGTQCFSVSSATVISWQPDEHGQFNSYCSSPSSKMFQNEGEYGNAPCGDTCRVHVTSDSDGFFSFNTTSPGIDGLFQRLHFFVRAEGFLSAFPVFLLQSDPWLNWVAAHCMTGSGEITCDEANFHSIHESFFGNSTKQIVEVFVDHFGQLSVNIDVVLCSLDHPSCPYVRNADPPKKRVCGYVWDGTCAASATNNGATSGETVSDPNLANCLPTTTTTTTTTTINKATITTKSKCLALLCQITQSIPLTTILQTKPPHLGRASQNS